MTSTDVREHNKNLDLVEAMIDKSTLQDVLQLVAEIASAKADHIRENWQDENAAASWDASAMAIIVAADNIERLIGSYPR